MLTVQMSSVFILQLKVSLLRETLKILLVCFSPALIVSFTVVFCVLV